jgi:hypothetical protein
MRPHTSHIPQLLAYGNSVFMELALCMMMVFRRKSLRFKYFILIILSLVLFICLQLLNANYDSTNTAQSGISQAGIQIPTSSNVGGRREGVGLREQKRNGGKIYALAWRYSGQQAAGIQGVASLQCWAGQSQLRAEVMEPIIRHNELTSTLEPHVDDAMRLGDYFDLKYLNDKSITAGYAQVTRREEFIENAPRLVVFVRSEMHDTEEKVVWSSSNISECYTEGRGDFRVIGHGLNKLRSLGYCVVKAAITAAGQLTHEKMMDILGEWKHRSVTLIVSLWKGPMALTTKCMGIGGGSALSHFYPSPGLLDDARTYYLNHIRHRSYSAVMIRLEHAAMLIERSPGEHSIKGCLQELVQRAETVQRRTGGHTPMVAADLGKYGSNTWQWAIKDSKMLSTALNDTKHVIGTLLQHQWSFEEWENTFVEAAGGITNEGYIAALQRTIASRADCLVLFGGGSFQQSVLQEYLHIHRKDRCVETVCLHFPDQMGVAFRNAAKR